MPKARIVNDLFLVNRALEVRNFVRIEREFDGEQFDVALLGPWPQPKSHPRTAAVFFQENRLNVVNPESEKKLKAFHTSLITSDSRR